MKYTKGEMRTFKGSDFEAAFSNRMTIEIWKDNDHDPNEAKANIKRLVKCWNMHDELLEALIEAKKFIIDMSPMAVTEHDLNEHKINGGVWDVIQSAIKKATE